MEVEGGRETTWAKAWKWKRIRQNQKERKRRKKKGRKKRKKESKQASHMLGCRVTAGPMLGAGAEPHPRFLAPLTPSLTTHNHTWGFFHTHLPLADQLMLIQQVRQDPEFPI